MIILIGAGIILLLLLLALSRVSVNLDYENGELTILARALTFKFNVFPRVKKRDERKKKRAKKKTPAEKKKTDITALTASAIRILRKLRRRVLIKRLSIVYIAGGMENPSSAALTHGALSAVLGVTQAALESAFRVKRYELYSNVNFAAKDTLVRVEAQISVAVWELVYIAFGELSVRAQPESKQPRTVKRKSSRSVDVENK